MSLSRQTCGELSSISLTKQKKIRVDYKAEVRDEER